MTQALSIPGPFAAAAAAAPPRKFPPAEPALRNELTTFLELNGQTRKQFAAKVGEDASRLSKFITGSNDFDVTLMERKVRDVLKAERCRSKEAVALFETPITRQIAGVYEIVRKTGDFGLIFSAAGLGKTSAMELFTADHPVAIGFTATKGACNMRAVEHRIFQEIENRGWDQRTPRWIFMVEHFKDSNRPLVVDNAQRLSSGALKWFFDFHDETGVPVIFQGNPEVLDKIRRNDQMFSRIGLKSEIAAPKPEVIAEITDSILQRMVPRWAETLRPLALQVASERGHFRSLRKQLTLAVELSLSGGPLAEPTAAFRAAHTVLVRNYGLHLGDGE